MPGLGQRLGVPESNALAATVLPGMGWGGRYNALAASAGELAERAALAFPTDAEAMAYHTLRARRGILPSGEEEQLAENYQSKMMQLALAGSVGRASRMNMIKTMEEQIAQASKPGHPWAKLLPRFQRSLEELRAKLAAEQGSTSNETLLKILERQ